jgi:hypothetical protein
MQANLINKYTKKCSVSICLYMLKYKYAVVSFVTRFEARVEWFAECSGFLGCVTVSLGETGFWWRPHTSTDLTDLLFLLPP